MRKAKGQFAAFIALIIFWWLASLLVVRFLKVPILPDPFIVFYEFFDLLLKKDLAVHVLYSLYRILAGTVVAWLLAGLLGMGMGRNKILDRLVSPVAYLLYPIPKIAFLPVIMLFLGIGDRSKIFIIGLIIFFQILVTTRDKVKEIRKEDLYSIQSLGAKKWDIYRHVILPYCLPGIYTAIRVSLGTALAVLFMAEYTGGTTMGVGYLIMDAFSRVDYKEMYASILALSTMGYVLFGIIDLLERITCPWNYVK